MPKSPLNTKTETAKQLQPNIVMPPAARIYLDASVCGLQLTQSARSTSVVRT